MGVTVGDRYISQENNEYIVREVEQGKAIAENLGKVDLLEGVSEKISITPLAESQENKLIALYHTHNGESYNPGPDSVPERGEIHDVGDKLASILEKKGVKVLHSDNLHLPHDGATYERSRGTALNLTKNQPDAIFDIHRDAIPKKSEYLTKIDGKTISQIRLVVGRQNPNKKANDQFARSLKAVTDKYYPGLIRDIFYGGGSYNQQISTHALLLEFGTHVIPENQVIASTNLMGDAIYNLLYGQDKNTSKATEKEQNNSSIKTFLWIFTISAIGLFSYLYLSEGSISQVKDRIKNYFSREITDNTEE
jgi:stage II sporulation protein P